MKETWNWSWSAAGAVMLAKGLVGAWATLVLLSASRLRQRRLFGTLVTHRHTGVGMLLLAFTIATVVFGIAILLREMWARVAGVVLEIIVLGAALTQVTRRPVLPAVSIPLSALVLVLLVRPMPEPTAPAP